MTRRTLVVFFLPSFGIAWGTFVLWVLFAAQAEALFRPLGDTNPLLVLAVCAPAIPAIGLVRHHRGGTAATEVLATGSGAHRVPRR